MKKNDLLKEIEKDSLLKALTDTLIETRENAMSIRTKIEMREGQLRDKLRNYGKEILPIYTQDIDKIESAIESTESQSSIERKIIALHKTKQITWTSDKEYREAMAQYYEYITPILADIEDEKEEVNANIEEMRARHQEELREQQNKLKDYNRKIKELLSIPGDYGMYLYSIQYNNQFGRKTRADYLTKISAEEYKKS